MGCKKYIFILIAGFLWTADVLSGQKADAAKKLNELDGEYAEENPYVGMQHPHHVYPKSSRSSRSVQTPISRSTFNVIYYPLTWYAVMQDDHLLHVLKKLHEEINKKGYLGVDWKDFLTLSGKYTRPAAIDLSNMFSFDFESFSLLSPGERLKKLHEQNRKIEEFIPILEQVLVAIRKFKNDILQGRMRYPQVTEIQDMYYNSSLGIKDVENKENEILKNLEQFQINKKQNDAEIQVIREITPYSSDFLTNILNQKALAEQRVGLSSEINDTVALNYLNRNVEQLAQQARQDLEKLYEPEMVGKGV